MKLIDRYLKSVQQYLPKSQQRDIIRELSEDIRSRQEAREMELGRPLRQDELDALLKQLGHPMSMAGQYLPQSQLIGPSVFPFYWYTLKFTLWAGAMMYVLAACTTPFVAGLLAALGKPVAPALLWSPDLGWIVGGGFIALLALFGLVTIIFAALDLFEGHYHWIGRWDSRKLVPVPEVPGEFLGKRTSFPLIISQLAISAVFILCWFAIPRFPMILVPDAVIEPGPAWQTFRLYLLLMMILVTIGSLFNLLRPFSMLSLWPLVHIARIAGLLWMYIYARSGNLVVGQQPLESLVNSSIAYGLLLCFCFTVLNFGITLAHRISLYLVPQLSVNRELR